MKQWPDYEFSRTKTKKRIKTEHKGKTYTVEYKADDWNIGRAYDELDRKIREDTE